MLDLWLCLDMSAWVFTRGIRVYAMVLCFGQNILSKTNKNGAKGLTRGRSLKQCHLTACMSNEGSGENLHMHRLTLAFTVRICDKYQNPMYWLKHFLKLSKI